jgi:hypothetical protein
MAHLAVSSRSMSAIYITIAIFDVDEATTGMISSTFPRSWETPVTSARI